jgi:hypothetical protein
LIIAPVAAQRQALLTERLRIMSNGKGWFTGFDEVPSVFQTEELAELHAIIQAVEYERSDQKLER